MSRLSVHVDTLGHSARYVLPLRAGFARNRLLSVGYNGPRLSIKALSKSGPTVAASNCRSKSCEADDVSGAVLSHPRRNQLVQPEISMDYGRSIARET